MRLPKRPLLYFRSTLLRRDRRMILRLRPQDAAWLLLETASTPLHTGVLAVLRLPARAPRGYMRDLAGQLRGRDELVPPWNCRLAGDFGFSPRLLEESDFDVDYHIRHTALPAPGGERELGVVVSRLHSQALDRDRPLWECHLIEGLERNRFALFFKVHHALVDGVNAVPLFCSMLSARARRGALVPPWSLALPRDDDDAAAGGELPRWLRALGAPASTAAELASAVPGVLSSLLRRARDGEYPLQRSAPRSTLNRRINAQRRVATQQFALPRVERLAQAADCSLNAVLAYLCSSALRRFFKEYNALPEQPLIAALPVALEGSDEGAPRGAVAGLRVALGTQIGDPLARLEAVKRAVAAVRAEREALPRAALMSYVLLRAAPLRAGQLPVVGGLVPPVFNLMVSSTEGPPAPRYLADARLEAVYPLSALWQHSALSIDCVSYADTLNIGFAGARDTLPHLQRLAVYAGGALEELERLLGAGGRA